MSVVQEFKNPMNPRETVLMAHGIIKRVSIKPIKGADPETGIKTTMWQGKTIQSSHTISLLVAEVDENDKLLQGGEEMWVSMGDKLLKPGHQDSVSIKINDKWETVVPGWIVNIPLKSNEYNGKTYYKGSLAKIVVLGAGEVPASAPKAQQKGQQQPKQGQGKQPQGNQQKPAQKGANDVLRIYGTITAIDGKSVTVDDQKIGVGVMVVNNPNQLKELVVGGRVAAVCDTAGNVLSGFKAYPPLESKEGAKRKKGFSKEGVEAGHAINAMFILRSRGMKIEDELQLCKDLHYVSVKVKKAYAERMNSELDAVGAPAGQAVLKGCEMVDLNSPNILEEIEILANRVLTELSDPLYDFIKENPEGVPPTGTAPGQEAKPQPTPEQKPEPQPEPQQNTVDDPPVEEEEPNPAEWDFDDSIPF